MKDMRCDGEKKVEEEKLRVSQSLGLITAGSYSCRG
jgi:hypothetical protein